MSPAGSADRRGHLGFTLVEILVVLAIAASMAAALGSLAFQREPGLKQQAETLARALRVLRASAISQGREQRLEIDLSDNRFIFPDRQIELAADIGITVTASRRQQRDRQRVAIAFFDDGSSSGGVIRLEKGEEQHRIRVNWLSGRVALQSGNDGEGGHG